MNNKNLFLIIFFSLFSLYFSQTESDFVKIYQFDYYNLRTNIGKKLIPIFKLIDVYLSLLFSPPIIRLQKRVSIRRWLLPQSLHSQVIPMKCLTDTVSLCSAVLPTLLQGQRKSLPPTWQGQRRDLRESALPMK